MPRQPVMSGSVSQLWWWNERIGATTAPAAYAGRVRTPSSSHSAKIAASFSNESPASRLRPRTQNSWLPGVKKTVPNAAVKHCSVSRSVSRESVTSPAQMSVSSLKLVCFDRRRTYARFSA